MRQGIMNSTKTQQSHNFLVMFSQTFDLSPLGSRYLEFEQIVLTNDNEETIPVMNTKALIPVIVLPIMVCTKASIPVYNNKEP
jgi:hypothetical protein